MKKYTEAKQVFESSLERNNSYASTYIMYGRLLSDIGMLKKSDEMFKLAQHYEPFNPIVYLHYSKLMSASKTAVKRLSF